MWRWAFAKLCPGLSADSRFSANRAGLGVRDPSRVHLSLSAPGDLRGRADLVVRTTTPRVPHGALPEAVARAARAGLGCIGRSGAAIRRWLCGLPAGWKAREAVLPPGAAGLGCWKRAGEERRGRAGPGGGRGWPGHAGRRAGEALLRSGSARPGAANASPRSPLCSSSRAVSGRSAARRVQRLVSIGQANGSPGGEHAQPRWEVTVTGLRWEARPALSPCPALCYPGSLGA